MLKMMLLVFFGHFDHMTENSVGLRQGNTGWTRIQSVFGTYVDLNSSKNVIINAEGNTRIQFKINGQDRGVINSAGGNDRLNFTGQHRTFINDIPFSNTSKEGLIVCSDQNNYIKMSGGVEYGKDGITINESLPVVSISSKVNDKSCFWSHFKFRGS